MDVFAQIENRVAAALDALKAEGGLPADVPTTGIEVETPRDPTHGDLATNAAMVLAKPARMKPRDIADKLQAKLAGAEGIEAVSVAGPGFSQSHAEARGVARAWCAPSSMQAPPTGAQTSATARRSTSSTFPPIRPARCTSAIAAAPCLATCSPICSSFAGFDVTREYYVNDAGGQVDVLARSVFLRYREALGEDIGDIPQGLYPGDYLKPVGAALANEHGPSLHQHARGALAADRAHVRHRPDDADHQGRIWRHSISSTTSSSRRRR